MAKNDLWPKKRMHTFFNLVKYQIQYISNNV